MHNSDHSLSSASEDGSGAGFPADLDISGLHWDHDSSGEKFHGDHLDQSICEDWSGSGSHVDFGPSDVVPLEPGRYLGRGAVGEVFEARCQGTVLALKRKFYRKKITENEKREVDILRKLSHFHVIRMIGTYTHGPFLGILMYPVAICDLATFFDDFGSVYSQAPLDPAQAERLLELGLPAVLWQQGSRPECSFLLSKIGCITGAIKYLHAQRVRHRDLKPSNILLSRRRVWVTDFGSSSDFSARSTSQTESGDRGTPKYFAPEVAQYLPSGRAADIFSLGCTFLEIITLCLHGSLAPLEALRPKPDDYNSFQANLTQMASWRTLLESDVPIYQHLMCEITQMLAEAPEVRPNAHDLHRRLTYIDQFNGHSDSVRIFDDCCRTTFYSENLYHKGTSRLNNRISNLQEKNRKLQRQLGEQNIAIRELKREVSENARISGQSEQRSFDDQLPRNRFDRNVGILRRRRYQAVALDPTPIHLVPVYNNTNDAHEQPSAHKRTKLLTHARIYVTIALFIFIVLTITLSTFGAWYARTNLVRVKGIIFFATICTSGFTVAGMAVSRRPIQETLLVNFLVGFALVVAIHDYMVQSPNGRHERLRVGWEHTPLF